MAPRPPKRRKLSHSSDEALGKDVLSSQDETASRDCAPVAKDTDVNPLDTEGNGMFVDGVGNDDIKISSRAGVEESVQSKQKDANTATLNGQNHSRRPSLPGGRKALTADTSSINTFTLQMEDLVKEVRLKDGKKEMCTANVLRRLKDQIETIPERDPQSISEAELRINKDSGLQIPFSEPRPPKDAKYKSAYARPANVNVVGSFPLKTATRNLGRLTIDLVVTMPSSLFQEKDYLNYRYFYKRAYYLACLAAGIKNSAGQEYHMRYSYLNCNKLQPILVLEPKDDDQESDFAKASCRIQIIPAIREDLFAPEKLSPAKNCIRPLAADKSDHAQKPQPTSFYNASIRVDSTMALYLKLLHGAAKLSESFRDACILGRVWLGQRGLGSDTLQGGFGNVEWSITMALLLQGGATNGKPLLSAGYSSYQLFRAMLQLLSTRDLAKNPLLLNARGVTLPKSDGCPTIFDGYRTLNVLFKMSPCSYAMLVQEARTSVAMLGDSRFDQFDNTFILHENEPRMKYDLIVRLSKSDVDEHAKIYKSLREGLGDRVELVSLFPLRPQDVSFDLEQAPSVLNPELLIGFITNPENAGRGIDHGPSAEDKKEAAAFRKFWGQKAELRRFKDGSVLETLTWSTDHGAPPVLEQIVLYVLGRHVSAGCASLAQFMGPRRGKLLAPSGTAASPLKFFQPLMETYKQLEQSIRSLEGLPLQIRQISAADAHLRYASIRPQIPGQAQQNRPANVVIQFEGSGRWPDDLRAVQKTKMAFLLKLAELIEAAVDGTTTRIGLENEEREIANNTFLDIIYPSSLAFRLRIHHDREQTLLERVIKDRGLTPKAREDAGLALAMYKRTFLLAPAHTQAVQNLCTRFPALSTLIRLLKKWFHAHLLSLQFTPEFVELLAVRTFTQPYPWQTPSSPETAFLRTLLFLSRWDWRREPLIVDFNGQIKKEDVAALNTRFEAWRKIDPALNRIVLFAASGVDMEGTTWTDGKPELVVAGRMSALARASVGIIRQQGASLDLRVLFQTSLEEYDFVLHLNPSRNCGRKRGKLNAAGSFKNLKIQSAADESLVDFRPVAFFVEELRRVYGHAVVLFHDEEEEDVIAGLWSPRLGPRSFKIGLSHSTMPPPPPTHPKMARPAVDQVEANREGMLAEMARLGGDLVEKIEVGGRKAA